jgi:hypothetical protein
MKQFDSMAREPFLMKAFPGLESKVYPAFLTVTLNGRDVLRRFMTEKGRDDRCRGCGKSPDSVRKTLKLLCLYSFLQPLHAGHKPR